MSRSELAEYVQALVIAVGLALVIIVFVAQAFVVQGSSMEPTLHDGERLLVDKLTYRFREPQRGEIVVFKYPADPSHRYIKRIIGIPGDTIRIDNGIVYVNGIPIKEDYTLEPALADFEEVVVPAGRYFVLGDNRNNSEDSRYPDVGFVPRNLIVGRAVFVFWPLGRLGLVRAPSLAAQLH
ncbi:MAG: signal peptidase I [Limnochordales bacterium]|nr:signal peptidase I [Limnochordales bacterium]